MSLSGGPSAAKVMGLTIMYTKTSLLYLAAGATLNLVSYLQLLPFSQTAFYIMQLYGFVAMMIFGISYLFIPAFSHSTLHSRTLAHLQFWLFNVGTIGLTVAFSGLAYGPLIDTLRVSALALQAVAVYVHFFNIWKTASGWKGSPGEVLARVTG